MTTHSSHFISALLICFGIGIAIASSTTAACDPSLSKVIFNENYDSINAKYLFIKSPYNVEITAGGPFAAWVNETDAVVADVIISDENVTLNFQVDNVDVGNIPNTNYNDAPTAATPGATPVRSGSPTKTSSATKLSSVFTVCLGVIIGGILFVSKKGLVYFVFLMALLSIISGTETRLSSELPCESATLTVQVPRYRVQFICINDLECICGPGYEGPECLLGGSPVNGPVDSPIADAPVDAPIASTPVIPPIDAPIEAPVAAPIDAPVTAPVDPPVNTPVDTPVAEPIAAPIDTPIATPVAPPVLAPIAAPVNSPVTTPVAAPVDAPINTPVATPIAAPVVAPVAVPVAAPIDTPVAVPVAGPSCFDGLLNGDETDVDCGGSCGICGPYKLCQVHADCQFGCNASECSLPLDNSGECPGYWIYRCYL